MEGGAHGSIKAIIDKIQTAIGDETDAAVCAELNATASIVAVAHNPVVMEAVENGGLTIALAMYDMASGKVNFIARSTVD